MCGDAKPSSKSNLDVGCVRPAENPMGGVVFVSCVYEVDLGVGISGKLCAVLNDVVGDVVVWNVIARGCCECVFKRVKRDEARG